MVRIERDAGWSALIVQLLGVAGAFVLLALVPGADTPTLVLPITPAAARGLPALVLDGHVSLLAAGPLPGSLVLAGRPKGGWALLRHGIIIVAAPAAVCGSLSGVTR